MSRPPKTFSRQTSEQAVLEILLRAAYQPFAKPLHPCKRCHKSLPVQAVLETELGGRKQNTTEGERGGMGDEGGEGGAERS